MTASSYTCWTVCAAALTSIAENYEALGETWIQAKEVTKDNEARARIGDVAKQMESFDFFFGVELGHIVFNMAENLSTLQGSSVSACDGQSVMRMTVTTLETTMRSDESFIAFWNSVNRKRQHCGIEEPTLHRQRKVPRKLEVGSSIPEM